jgi:heat shock protein HslJ
VPVGRVIPILLLGAAVCALAACGDREAPAIEGTWELAALYADGREVPAIAGARPVLLLQGGKATGNSGCNLFSASYTLASSRLHFAELVTTERACAEPDRNEQEARFYAALSLVDRVLGHGAALELGDADGQRLLVFRRPAP